MERRNKGSGDTVPDTIRDAFEEKRKTLLDIQHFIEEDIDASDLLLGSDELTVLLRTDNGRYEASRWLRAYKRTLAYVQQFHDEVESGMVYSAGDWQSMNSSADSILTSLTDMLQRIED